MPKYREQFVNLIKKLEEKISEDEDSDLKVTRVRRAGSWPKGTILRPTGENPIDVDLIFYIDGEANLTEEIGNLHDFVVDYLAAIYPMKDINRDVDADGKTKSVKIKFSGTGLEVDIVPVVAINEPKEYVWQPERGGGGRYITSITGQLEFARGMKNNNSSFTSILRSLKWWRNYKELKSDSSKENLSSFTIELILSYLEIVEGIETNIETGIIRFFEFVSRSNFPKIKFKTAINQEQSYASPIFVGDPTNNENNTVKKMTNSFWEEVQQEANEAFETLCIAQARNNSGDTTTEWKRVFGPSFNITEEN